MNAAMQTARAGASNYRFKPFPGSSHTLAVGAVDRLVAAGALNPNASVLDIGCGAGYVGGVLRSRGLSNLYAVEVDPAAREQARATYIRIEDGLPRFKGEQFDLLLMLDVLEHLSDPFAVFAEAISLLKPGGHAIISLPNIAHWSVRIPLLFGRFKYQKSGLLDETHLQFFTRARIRQLIASQPSLALLRIDASIAPLELILPSIIWDNALFRLSSRLRLAAARCLPGLLAFQNLAITRKSR